MSDELKILAGAPPASHLPPDGAGAYPHPYIAREGWPFIAASVVAAGLTHWLAGGWWALPMWLVVALMVQFFRDPPRVTTRKGVPDTSCYRCMVTNALAA